MKKKIINKASWYITPSEKEMFADYCSQHRINYKELAEQLGIEQDFFSHILNGHVAVSAKKVLLFKEKLGIRLKYEDVE